MSTRIPEKALVMPSLLIMERRGGHIQTSELIKELELVLDIKGEDLEILQGRSDTKFSQKVRNLKSHDTFEKLGFATFNNKEEKFEITEKGRLSIKDNKDSLLYLLGNNFNSNDSMEGLNSLTEHQDKMEVFDEDILITEGSSEYVLSKKIKRSVKLRNYAIEYYLDVRGNISCDICGFDFEYVYGEPAAGYIEMHHLEPVYMYKGDDIQKTIEDAIKNLLPVCANCHRVIHRTRPPYEISDVRQFYEDRLVSR